MSLALHMIEKAAREEKMAHFLLLHGGRGKERRAFAVRLAQILNCLGEKRPCGECLSCRKIVSGNHPDVSVEEPLKTSIGIEQILSWQEKVYRMPYEGKMKVFLLDKADLLTVPAGNALLKILEEPPAHTVIILSADNGEGILPTLRSRAQSIYVPPLSAEAWLKEEKGHEGADGQVEKALSLSGDNPELAEAIENVDMAKLEDWLTRFKDAVSQRNFLKLFPLFPLEKEEASVYLQVLAARYRQGLMTGQGGPGSFLAVGRALEALREQAGPRLVVENLALELFNLH